MAARVVSAAPVGASESCGRRCRWDWRSWYSAPSASRRRSRRCWPGPVSACSRLPWPASCWGKVGALARHVEASAGSEGGPRQGSAPSGPLTGELAASVERLARLGAEGRARLASERAELERALDALPEPLLLLDADRKIVRANRAATALLDGEVAGRHIAASPAQSGTDRGGRADPGRRRGLRHRIHAAGAGRAHFCGAGWSRCPSPGKAAPPCCSRSSTSRRCAGPIRCARILSPTRATRSGLRSPR